MSREKEVVVMDNGGVKGEGGCRDGEWWYQGRRGLL